MPTVAFLINAGDAIAPASLLDSNLTEALLIGQTAGAGRRDEDFVGLHKGGQRGLEYRHYDFDGYLGDRVECELVLARVRRAVHLPNGDANFNATA